MGTFFTAAQEQPCVIGEQITLTDCLACSGCISTDEASGFTPDLSFFSTQMVPTGFVISPQAKQSIFNALGWTEYRAFENALSGYLRQKLGAVQVVDTSYIMKENEPERTPETISSECPAVVLYIERVFPDLVPLLSTSKTYQQLAAEFIRASHPECRVVSVMHCYDKKDELKRDGTNIDYFIGARDLLEFIRRDQFSQSSYKAEHWELTHQYYEEEVSGLESCVLRLIKLRSRCKGGPGGDALDSKDKSQIAERSTIELRICTGGCGNGPALPCTIPWGNMEHIVSAQNRIQYKSKPRVFKKGKKRTFAVDW